MSPEYPVLVVGPWGHHHIIPVQMREGGREERGQYVTYASELIDTRKNKHLSNSSMIKSRSCVGFPRPDKT